VVENIWLVKYTALLSLQGFIKSSVLEDEKHNMIAIHARLKSTSVVYEFKYDGDVNEQEEIFFQNVVYRVVRKRIELVHSFFYFFLNTFNDHIIHVVNVVI